MKKTILQKLLVCSFFFLALGYSAISQPTPVVCMPFNSNAQDLSGNNHHGIVLGATLTTDRNGSPNSAYDFDGVNDQIQISDPINSYLPNDNLTIIFWASADMLYHNSPFMLQPDNLSDRFNISIHYDHNGTPWTFWDYGNIFGNGRLDQPTPFSSAWAHYAFIVNASANTMRIYKNGVLLTSQSGYSPLVNRTRSLYIGGGMASSPLYFDGKIDDVQIFDVAFTATQVNDNFLNSSTCITVGVSEITDNNDFNIYPNPANNSVDLTFNKPLSAVCNVEILDAKGKQVKIVSVEPVNNKITLDIEELTTGTYIIMIRSQENVYTGKIIKN